MKAIETAYKGYRFRSRLEARWAVFLDSLGIQWQYEKEGFDLNGEWYLPDFWVPYPHGPGWGFWIEIKPSPIDDRETRLLRKLAESTGHRSFALCGSPWPGEHRVSVFQHHHNGVPDNIPMILNGRLEEMRDFSGRDNFERLCTSNNLLVVADEGIIDFVGGLYDIPFGSLSEAFRAARSARFEHGDCPKDS